MKSGSGQSAAGRFLRRQPPAGDDFLRILVAVMAFDVKDGAELAACDDVAQRAHRRPEAPVVADRERDAGLAASQEHPRSIGAMQRERLLAEYLFSCGSAGDDLRRMQ